MGVRTMLRLTSRIATGVLVTTGLLVGAAAGPAHAAVPDTFIDSGPAEPDNYLLPGPVTFTFHSDDLTATFECSLNGTAPTDYTACTSPYTLSNLPIGASYFFRVRAVVGGVKDPQPAVRFFYIRNVPCEQAGEAYADAQARYFSYEDKLGRAKAKLHRIKRHGTAAQLQHQKNKIRKLKGKARQWKDAMNAAIAQENAVC